ncbi:Melanopsin [Trichoplax sp. H2]|nr:Melanopsin [Trichoplax sp. H2]|eukprot:RDD40517.1 Melanopsin [Trichoplax sp. H2]
MEGNYSCTNLTMIQNDYRLVYGIILISATVFGLLGNIVLLYIISTLKRRISTDIFIVGIAIFGLLCIPLHVISIFVYFSHDCRYYLRSGTFTCNFYGWLLTMISSNEVILVVLISLDQYIAIVHPFVYRNFVTNTTTFIAFITTCIISALHSSYPLLTQIHMVSISPYYSFCHFDYKSKLTKATGYTIFLFSLGMVLCIVNVFCTISILRTLCRIAKRRHQIHPCYQTGPRAEIKSDYNGLIANLLKRNRLARRSEELAFAKASILLFILCFSSWLAFSVVAIAGLIYHKTIYNAELALVRIWRNIRSYNRTRRMTFTNRRTTTVSSLSTTTSAISSSPSRFELRLTSSIYRKPSRITCRSTSSRHLNLKTFTSES